MRIGINSQGYPIVRMIEGKVERATYVPLSDAYKWASSACRRYNRWVPYRLRIDSSDLQRKFWRLGRERVDICHLFNAISYGREPWVVTFETVVPRFGCVLQNLSRTQDAFETLARVRSVRCAIDRLARDSCRQIIALSECTRQIQLSLLQLFPEHRDKVESKLVTLHPPQVVRVPEYQAKHRDLRQGVNFLFVGSSFFRKGGREILEAFAMIRRRWGAQVHLTVISALRIDNYATAESLSDVDSARRFIGENREWLTWHDSLPNECVLKLMEMADVGLLPTHADTYGFSVLEFQACGTPVITTDVRALPEINNSNVGWVIELPKNRFGEARYATEEQREENRRLIRTGLEKCVEEILVDRDAVRMKAENAIRRIRNEHDPVAYGETLRQVYLEAVGDSLHRSG